MSQQQLEERETRILELGNEIAQTFQELQQIHNQLNLNPTVVMREELTSTYSNLCTVCEDNGIVSNGMCTQCLQGWEIIHPQV